MVHPTELLRSNSNTPRTFAAPLSRSSEYHLDCGITNLQCINWSYLEKFATPKVFLVFLSLVGFLQGVTLTYFRETASLWGRHYNISQENIDWLIYTNEFFIGLFALLVAYYGNRIHRISWIGGVTILQAVTSAVLLIPEVYRKNYRDYVDISEPYLCNHKLPASSDTELNYIALAILTIFQIFIAVWITSFTSHGITYLDDNTLMRTSPGYIGIALAFRELGKQAGLYFSWIPIYLHLNVFASPIWLCVAAVAFVTGIFMAMFPKNLPSIIVKTMSASIVDLAAGHDMYPRNLRIDGFFMTIFRLLKNKILMVNICGAVLLEAALVNFNIFEKHFKQARFQVSHFNDASLIQFTSNILKQPVVAISLIAAGFVAAKTKPHLKSLAKWNIVATLLIILVFSSTAFLNCEPNTTYRDITEKCNHCNCIVGEFQPVCIESKTVYSPCFAGCTGVEHSSRREFTNCTCRGNAKADEGPCDEEKCSLFYALSQVNNVFTSALLATTLVTNLIINMRCILSRDKATALGLEATFIALITYLPVKAIYGAVAENYCIFPKNNKHDCTLYSKHFGTFLSVVTICVMAASLIFDIVVLILLKSKSATKSDDDDDSSDVHELQPIRNSRIGENTRMNSMIPEEVDSGQYSRRSDSAHSPTNSLLEMENVGDDHDSLGSLSQLSRNRTLESDL